MLTINFILVAILIIATAFFVATEFAIVRVRPSRVDQMVLEGKKNALAVQKVTSNLDGYLAACQLGITITAMGLGWLGEPTVARLMYPLFERLDLPAAIVSLVSFLIAFLIMTYLHVVFGELAPKTVAIQKAEAVSLWLAKPLIFFYRVMYPLIWLLNGSALKFIALFGVRPAKDQDDAHSEEELRLILSESYKSGNINKSEFGYVTNIFTFDEMTAKEIMIPRMDMVVIDAQLEIEEILEIIKQERYTRFPVIDGDKDHIVGILNTKQFFLKYYETEDFELSEVLQPVMAVPETTSLNLLLKKMQKQSVHFAILLDEFGGTSGMITIEDIIEEIVGEIRDEFDEEEEPEIEELDEFHLIVDGKVPVVTVNQRFNVAIESEDFDTIGGWLLNQNEAIRKTMKHEFLGLEFTVLEKERHRIRKIEIKKLEQEPDSEVDEEQADDHEEQEQ